MMDPNNHLIMVKGEDKTHAIKFWKFERDRPIVHITYNNGRSYPYSAYDVAFFRNPKSVTIRDSIVLKRDIPLTNVDYLLFFSQYCRIYYQNGHRELTDSSSIQIVKSVLNLPKPANCFRYLKQIAIQTGLTVEGNNLLAAHYNKMNFVREDSALASFLSGELSSPEQNHQNAPVLYPFGFNLSQKKAVENALSHQISVIEGPPGTGKTQTILNIIANAIIRGKSVAVVSGNNAATANVAEKLEKYGFGFLVATLGNSSNKKLFLEEQVTRLPDMDSWSNMEQNGSLAERESALNQNLSLKNELSYRLAERDSLEKEYLHFTDYYQTLSWEGNNLPTFSKRKEASYIIKLLAEYEWLTQTKKKVGFLQKSRFALTYGFPFLSFFDMRPELVAAHCQNAYYIRRKSELDKQIAEIEKILSSFDFESKMKEYTEASLVAFKTHLVSIFGKSGCRKRYEKTDLFLHPEQFVQDYPVVLSTAFSICDSLSDKYIFDYVIVDEASQVDLVTGALALSCGKRLVIVGDIKQLPNVVTADQKELTDNIFQRFDLPDAYRYANHSLLSSVVQLFPNVAKVLLKEHYRCHPEIIGFCNQRFYNGELIVLSKPKSDRQSMAVYRTVPGNHARGRVNQRQIDVIVKEVIPEQNLSLYDGSVGIVTPYRKQADALQQVFADTAVKADTADKFQGQERSVMIFSTVDNEIGDFASDPNRLNVAVSRAVDQFIVVTDGNDNDTSSAIHDLIGYIQYHNHQVVHSEVRSVFDYLYQSYAEAREEIMNKYGRVSDVESENLMYQAVCQVLSKDGFSQYGVAIHVPLRMLLNDYQRLSTEELVFTTNHLTHVDFLIYSKLTHLPVLVLEVDGFAFHKEEKQKERDRKKDTILQKYRIPILRFSTVGSDEQAALTAFLEKVNG